MTTGTTESTGPGGLPEASRPAAPSAPEAPPPRGFWRDFSLPAVLAGLIAVVVSYSGPFVIILTAAAAGGLTEAQTGSWVWAISIGSGATCLGLSLLTRMPVITAWSTPGAALLVTSLADYPYREAVGAFLVTGVLITVIGVSGVFGWLTRQVPAAVVSAMLAGILFGFGTTVFTSLKGAPLIAGTVLGAYLVAKRWTPRYAVPVALLLGLAAAAADSRLHVTVERFELARPELTSPAFSLTATIGIAVPLLLATLASQNAPGMAVLAASGYRADDRLLIGSTGLVSTVLAPFGSHAVNLAAITAAICTGPEAHPDPRRRYIAGVSAGFFYLLIGTLGSTVVVLFAGLPKELVAAVAGVALFGALLGGLAGAMADEKDREPALVTFLATASGMTLFGIGSAFWGLVFGMAAHLILSTSPLAALRARRAAKPAGAPADEGDA
ncbi:benzoate/H(+) symporter BenE family transporter [Yinghuangia soli]|uniref:Benzoate/H(+) symporter BenE family transporter n=1 Tax=Yinghuangia soli TaxID=2908204 RepID=A0AA41PVP3_9ACTN|nr:benzoate/H(+) symporter BenE family transporter [Yinghuangia soli]MCF2526556.1 benzoate/H(+) symporter BenE family transporter [Yinghuangia soli]